MKKIKRKLSFLLAFVMAFSVTESAMAAGPEDSGAYAVTVEELDSIDSGSEDIVVVGSDGKQYEEVIYLTAGSVMQFSAEQQENYEWLCDKAAEISEDGTDWSRIEIVVNDKGIPELQWALPTRQVMTMGPSEENAFSLETTLSGEEDIASFDASFDRAEYLKSQLSDIQKVYFDATVKAAKKADKKLMKDGIWFITDTEPEKANDFYDAYAAAYYSYPQYFEWHDMSYLGEVYTFEGKEDDTEYYGLYSSKSKYYKSSFEKKAKKKIKSLVKKARDYAKKHYPKDKKYGILRYFDNWIAKNNYYDERGTDFEHPDNAAFFYCHSSYGCLLKGYGVCESYGRAMARLMDAAGITNLLAGGVAYFGQGSGGHVWNQVYLKGNWYLEDSTWNCDTTKKKKYPSNRKYFLIGSAEETEYGSAHNADANLFSEQKKYLYPSISVHRYGWTEEQTYSAAELLPAA